MYILKVTLIVGKIGFLFLFPVLHFWEMIIRNFLIFKHARRPGGEHCYKSEIVRRFDNKSFKNDY